jgi:urea transport system substrate-binding protein
MAPHGLGNEMGAKVAQEYLNAKGGIMGKKIELVVLDGASDPSVNSERTKELIQKHHVNLLVGTTSSATTLAAIGPATDAGVPFIYSLDGECKTSKPGSPSVVSANIWGSGFTERMVVEPMLRYLGELSKKPKDQFKIYMIGGDYVYPRSTNGYAKEVAAKLGYKLLGEDYSDTKTEDYSIQIRKILAAKPDLLIVTNPGESGVRFMKQAKTFNLSSQMIVSGFATFDQEMIKQMGTASEGVYCINRYSKSLNNPENKEFLAIFNRLYPGENLLPGPTAAAGVFGSMLVAANAFNKANSTELTAFAKAMKGMQLKLPQGEIKVNESNNIFDQHVYLMRIQNQQYQVISDLGMQTHPGLEGTSVP